MIKWHYIQSKEICFGNPEIAFNSTKVPTIYNLHSYRSEYRLAICTKIPPIFTYICTFGFGFGIRPKARCFSGQIFGFGLKWKTYFRSFTERPLQIFRSSASSDYIQERKNGEAVRQAGLQGPSINDVFQEKRFMGVFTKKDDLLHR